MRLRYALSNHNENENNYENIKSAQSTYKHWKKYHQEGNDNNPILTRIKCAN